MSSNSKKMGFWAVFAIVFGSQIGSGIFMLPSVLAPYGMFGIYGWCLSGAGAMLLAFIFSELCSKFPQTGGPHVYVKEEFGMIPAFFVGWGYWLVSWVSTSVVIVSAIAYLSPLLNNPSPTVSFILEVLLLFIITAINCKSVKLSAQVEFSLTILKFIPFVIVPIILIQNFDSSCIKLAEEFSSGSFSELISTTTILCFWGFIGVECATTPAGYVRNPEKTIPKAIILGTTSVAIVYFINSIAIMGVIPGEVLAKSAAPFVDAIEKTAGKNVSLLISIIASIVCIGTLNSWVLTSAQISLGLAQKGLLPTFFAKKNSENSPYVSVLISSLGLIPILILTKQESYSAQVTCIINFSVMVFLMVYLACCAVFLKLAIKEKQNFKIAVGISALIFCLFTMSDASFYAIFDSLLFFLSGFFILPFAPFINREGSRVD